MTKRTNEPSHTGTARGVVSLWTTRLLPPLAGILLAILGVLILKGQARGAAAWDYSLYYTCGHLQGHELFNKQKQMEVQQAVWNENLRDLRVFVYSIYLKPAVYKLVLNPLSTMPFWTSYVVWECIQCAGLVLGIWIIGRRTGCPPAFWILLPLSPFVSAMVTWGQDTGLIFLMLAISWELSLRGHWFGSGCAAALTLVKWNLFIVFVPVLIVQRRWRALCGFGLVALIGAVLSIYVSGWAGTMDYIRLLGDREADFLAAGMPSIRGALLWYRVPEIVTNLAIAGLLIWTWAVLRECSWRDAFALGITACVVLSYHTMTYDVMFLLIPLLLLQTTGPLSSGWAEALIVAWCVPLRLPPPSQGLLTVALAGLLYVAVLKPGREATKVSQLMGTNNEP